MAKLSGAVPAQPERHTERSLQGLGQRAGTTDRCGAQGVRAVMAHRLPLRRAGHLSGVPPVDVAVAPT